MTLSTAYPVVRGGSLQADSTGHYYSPAATGTYTVSATAPGYSTSSAQARVRTGITVTVDLALQTAEAKVYLPLVRK